MKKQTKKATDSMRKATDNVFHRIAEVKEQYGADNAEGYRKLSDRIKKERG